MYHDEADPAVNTGKLAPIAEDLLENGILSIEDPDFSSDDISGFYAYDPEPLLTNRKGEALIDSLVRGLREDPAIAANIAADDVRRQVVEWLTQVRPQHRAGALKAGVALQELHDGLISDQRDWMIYRPLPGLIMPLGSTLGLAGLRIGPLETHEREEILRVARSAVQSRAEPEEIVDPSTSAFIQRTTRLLDENRCWARGAVRAREQSAIPIFDEKAQTAVAALRCFAHSPAVAIDPDRSLIGQLFIPGGTDALRYALLDGAVPDVTTISGRWARHDIREDYVLSEDGVAKLLGDPHFQYAQRIAAASTRSPMEHKLLLAMHQYAAASTAERAEVKLQNYLTVVEMLFARDDVEFGGRADAACRRLALSVGEQGREEFRDRFEALHQVRNGPVHLGHRNLLEREVITERDLADAKRYAYRAIMYALQRGEGYATPEEFVNALDTEFPSKNQIVGRPSYLVTRCYNPATGMYEVTTPDLPGCHVEGRTKKEAHEAMRRRMTQYVQSLVDAGQPVPPSTAEEALWLGVSKLPKQPRPRS